MASQFDELAKNLAGGMSRREALRRFGLGLLGALLAALGLGALTPREALGQNSNCFYFCKAVYPNDPAAQAACGGSGGLCSQCGPAAPPPRRALCKAPGSNAVCCPSGQVCCGNSTCSSLLCDDNNCGACGRSCGPNAFCIFNGCYHINAPANKAALRRTLRGKPYVPAGSVCSNPIGSDADHRSLAPYFCREGCGVCAQTVAGNTVCGSVKGSFCSDCTSDDDCPSVYACVTAPSGLCPNGRACAPVLDGCTG